MHMLVGIIVEVVHTVAKKEREKDAARFLRDSMEQWLAASDADDNGLISHKEFEDLLTTPAVIRGLGDAGINIMDLLDYSSYIFRHTSEITFDALHDKIISLRNSNVATVKDFVDMQMYLSEEMNSIEANFLKLFAFQGFHRAHCNTITVTDSGELRLVEARDEEMGITSSPPRTTIATTSRIESLDDSQTDGPAQPVGGQLGLVGVGGEEMGITPSLPRTTIAMTSRVESLDDSQTDGPAQRSLARPMDQSNPDVGQDQTDGPSQTKVQWSRWSHHGKDQVVTKDRRSL